MGPEDYPFYYYRKKIFFFLCLAMYLVNCYQYRPDIYGAFYEIIVYTIFSILFWGGGLGLPISLLLMVYFACVERWRDRRRDWERIDWMLIMPTVIEKYGFGRLYAWNTGLIFGIFCKLIFNFKVHNIYL